LLTLKILLIIMLLLDLKPYAYLNYFANLGLYYFEDLLSNIGNLYKYLPIQQFYIYYIAQAVPPFLASIPIGRNGIQMPYIPFLANQHYRCNFFNAL